MKIPTNVLKHTLISALVLASFTFVSSAQAAGSCGQGKIVEVIEGGWNTDDLMIKLSSQAGAQALWQTYYVRYRASLGAERLRGLRAVAYLAMAGDKTVAGYTHNANCTLATQLTIQK